MISTLTLLRTRSLLALHHLDFGVGPVSQGTAQILFCDSCAMTLCAAFPLNRSSWSLSLDTIHELSSSPSTLSSGLALIVLEFFCHWPTSGAMWQLELLKINFMMGFVE